MAQLVSVRPGDGATIGAGAVFTLTYSAPVAPAGGVVRFINEDDPTDVVTADVTDTDEVWFRNDQVYVSPPGYLTTGASYTLWINDGVFVDSSGQSVMGVYGTYDVTVANELPSDLVLEAAQGGDALDGAGGRDSLFGRNGDDTLDGLANDDQLVGRGGMTVSSAASARTPSRAATGPTRSRAVSTATSSRAAPEPTSCPAGPAATR